MRPSIEPSSCSSCDNSGWRTISVMWCSRAMMVQSTAPIRPCYLPPACFSRISGSREGTTEAASGNCCIQSSTVCIVGLYLWRAAWSTGGSWSWTPTTGRGLRPAKASRWDWGSIRACLDSSVALQVLQEAHGLHSLRAACEDKVAEDFETCSKHPDFGKLSASQLVRIMRREDLAISREEEVVNAVFAWTKVSKDGHAFLGMLLQHVHFNSLSIENLLRLGRTTLSLSGPSGDDLQRSWGFFNLPKEDPKFRYFSVEEVLSPALVTLFWCQHRQHWSFRARGTALSLCLSALALWGSTHH